MDTKIKRWFLVSKNKKEIFLSIDSLDDQSF
jgi:hypothetical protein